MHTILYTVHAFISLFTKFRLAYNYKRLIYTRLYRLVPLVARECQLQVNFDGLFSVSVINCQFGMYSIKYMYMCIYVCIYVCLYVCSYLYISSLYGNSYTIEATLPRFVNSFRFFYFAVLLLFSLFACMCVRECVCVCNAIVVIIVVKWKWRTAAAVFGHWPTHLLFNVPRWLRCLCDSIAQVAGNKWH